MLIFERNLAALQEWTPETAALLAAAEVPAGFERAVGTDGTPTYRRFVEEGGGGLGRVEWLGGTSMPHASAEPLVAALDARAGNGLGLSIGTGHEWAAFASKLSGAQAIFVYESDVAAVRMALEVADIAGQLAAGKIVVFAGTPAAASDALARFLSQHIGFEPPTVLQPLSTLSSLRRNDYLAAGEAMVRRAVLERQALNQAIATRVEASLEGPGDGVGYWLLTPRYPGERPLQTMIGSDSATLAIDRHGSASIAARLEFLEAHRPQKIVSDFFRAQLGCVPQAVEVETWIPPLAGPAFWDRLPAPSSLQEQDRVIVHGGGQQRRLIALGFAQASVEVRELPAAHGEVVQRAVAGRRVALFGDLVKVDAQEWGVVLPTHQAVFDAAIALINADPLGVHEGSAADILRRALEREKVQSSKEGAMDPLLREPMLRLIRDVFIPTLPMLFVARELMKHGVPLVLLGDWPGIEITRGADVTLQPLGKLAWDDVALLVDISPTGSPSPVLWEAVAAGVAIVSPEQPSDRQAGAVPSLLKADAEFARPARQQLINVVKGLLRDGGRRQALASAAQAHLKKLQAIQVLD